MKVKKGIFNKCFILQFLIVGVFIIIGFTEFRAGEEFQVNTYTESGQGFPAVAMDEKGNFVITWESIYQDGSEKGIFAQRFNKNGKPLGPEFQVNSHTIDLQQRPAVAMDAKGNFVIAWESYGQDGSGYGVFAKMFKKQEKSTSNTLHFNH